MTGGEVGLAGSARVNAQRPAVLASNFSHRPTGALLSVDYGNGTTSRRNYTSGGLLVIGRDTGIPARSGDAALTQHVPWAAISEPFP